LSILQLSLTGPKTFIKAPRPTARKLTSDLGCDMSTLRASECYISIFKVMTLGAQSGIRVTYAYFSDEDRIEFIEIYYKGDQLNEDRERIKVHYFT
jgi:hypothetical protein